MVNLKYLNKFWRILAMLLIKFEISLARNWSENCVIVANNVNQESPFLINYTKLYVPGVTSFTRYNKKLLGQLKSGFKRTINWNRYRWKLSIERQNRHLDFLIDPSFQGVNRVFVLLFEDEEQRTRYKWYYLPTVEMKRV